MFAIRSRRKSISEKDFLDAVQKVCAVSAANSTVEQWPGWYWALRSRRVVVTLRVAGHQELQEVLVHAEVHGVQLDGSCVVHGTAVAASHPPPCATKVPRNPSL